MDSARSQAEFVNIHCYANGSVEDVQENRMEDILIANLFYSQKIRDPKLTTSSSFDKIEKIRVNNQVQRIYRLGHGTVTAPMRQYTRKQITTKTPDRCQRFESNDSRVCY